MCVCVCKQFRYCCTICTSNEYVKNVGSLIVGDMPARNSSNTIRTSNYKALQTMHSSPETSVSLITPNDYAGYDKNVLQTRTQQSTILFGLFQILKEEVRLFLWMNSTFTIEHRKSGLNLLRTNLWCLSYT